MRNQSKRLAHLEARVGLHEPEESENKHWLPTWLEYPKRSFERGQVRPGVYRRVDGRDCEWAIDGPWVHYFVDKLREHGAEIPDRFTSLEECEATIEWLTETFWETMRLAEQMRQEAA